MHRVEVVGPAQKSLIPSAASAAVSIRIVPDQSLEDIIDKFRKHLEEAFATLRTENKFEVRKAGSFRVGPADTEFAGPARIRSTSRKPQIG